MIKWKCRILLTEQLCPCMLGVYIQFLLDCNPTPSFALDSLQVFYMVIVDVVSCCRVGVAIVIDLVPVVMMTVALRICCCSGIFRCLCTWVLPGCLRSNYISQRQLS